MVKEQPAHRARRSEVQPGKKKEKRKKRGRSGLIGQVRRASRNLRCSDQAFTTGQVVITPGLMKTQSHTCAREKKRGKRPDPPRHTSIMDSISGSPPERAHPLTRDGCCTLGRHHILWAEFRNMRVLVSSVGRAPVYG